MNDYIEGVLSNTIEQYDNPEDVRRLRLEINGYLKEVEEAMRSGEYWEA